MKTLKNIERLAVDANPMLSVNGEVKISKNGKIKISTFGYGNKAMVMTFSILYDKYLK